MRRPKLLLHGLEVGECDLEAASRVAAGGGAAGRLDELVDVGLLVRSRVARRTDVYCVADAAAVRLLLEKVEKLGSGLRPARAPASGGGRQTRRASAPGQAIDQPALPPDHAQALLHEQTPGAPC